MRNTLLSLAVISSFAAPALALAQTAPAAPAAAPSPVTGNMTIASDYRFRGISQTYKGPAIQGGIDYAHDSGIYLGNWNSNVNSALFTGGSGIEMDFYGGWKKAFGDFGLDIGYIYYYYPNAEWNSNVGSTNGTKKFDNQEVYIGGSWKWISAKYSYALSDYFGLNKEQAAGGYWVNKDTGAALGDKGNSKGTYYFDLTATYPVTDKFNVIGHFGKLNAKHYSELNYQDWKLGATYDLNGWVLGASFITTNAKKEWYYTAGAKGARNIGESTVVFSVAKTF
jgi:uncharacterized protein (TIGR02001 family)